jgi:hypothetical protein
VWFRHRWRNYLLGVIRVDAKVSGYREGMPMMTGKGLLGSYPEEPKPDDFDLEKYPEREPDDNDLEIQLVQLAERGEPAHVLLTAAVIEEWLERLLLSQMRELSNGLAKKIFGGPLNAFSAKIDVAYALKLIEEDTWSDLKAIKNIRNAFAHTSDFLHFHSPDVVNLFSRFKGGRPPGVGVKDFFDQRAARSVDAMKAKLDEIVYLSATRDDASPGEPS